MRRLLLIVILLIILLILLLKCRERNNEEYFNNYNRGINSFDKFLYINLENRKDRKKQLLYNLEKVDIPKHKIERIDAVYEKYNGHLGCCKSHIKALERAKELDLNTVVILEDDFIFTIDKKRINKKINHFLKKYPDFDVVQFNASYTDLKDINDKHIKKVNSAMRTTSYVVKHHFIDYILNNFKEAEKKMTEEMKLWLKENPNKKKYETRYAIDQHWAPLQKENKWYLFSPEIGKDNTNLYSTIMGGIEGFNNNVKFYKINL